jgi:hypothetical protein
VTDVRAVQVPEPKLLFGHGQRCEFVKDGLFSFGPLTGLPGGSGLRFGVIGTEIGCGRFHRWAAGVRSGIARTDLKAHRMAWPGFAAVFEADWPEKPVAQISVDAEAVRESIRRANRYEAVFETVGIYEKAILQYLKREELRPDFWFVVIEEEVYRLGRPEQDVPAALRTQSQLPMSGKTARKLAEGGSGWLFSELEQDVAQTLEVEAYEVNFHNQLKARLLKHHVVVQILRETTLTPDDFLDRMGRRVRNVDDPSTIAWNLCTTAFFKAQGRPWQLDGVRPGVCYIGIVFKQLHEPTAEGNACCGAQMFLDSGDGVVFKGVEGNWFKSERKECHLSQGRAAELMRQVIEMYRDKHDGKAPSEVFLHGRVRFDDEEWKGFESAVPKDTRLAGVRIRRSLVHRMYRAQGQTPVLRGSALILSSRRALLWSLGYVPRLQTYPGWEVPAPLEVEVSQGRADIEQVLADVLGLTKLNYNACIYADGMPVTLRFADNVGEILTAAPGNETYKPLPFRYYI